MKRRERERKVEEAKTRNEQETKVDGGTEACAGSACALRASNNLFRSQFVLRECRVASYESKYNAGTWCNLFTVRAFSSVCVCYYVHLCASRVCRCVCVCVYPVRAAVECEARMCNRDGSILCYLRRRDAGYLLRRPSHRIPRPIRERISGRMR